MRDIDQYIRQGMEKWKIPGAAVGILRDGEILLCRGYGYRDVENSLPVDEHTLFRLASVTKTFTPAVIAKLVSEGILDWDAPLRQYRDDIILYDESLTESVTLRDVACHRTGIPRSSLMGQNPTLTDAEYIAMLRHLKPNLGFRDEFQYQNQLFAMLGCVASTVMGRPFEEILQDELLTPLGLADTAMADREMMDGGNSALPYRINERRGFHKLGYTPDAHADYPAGNLVSSLSDMLRYLRFHMQDGMLDGCAIVAQDALRETHTNQIAQQPGIGVEECTDLFYCLGWNAANYRGRRILYHSGDYKGYATNISFMPEHDIGIVFLSNLDQNLLGEALHLNIYDLLLEDGITDFNDHYMQVQAAMFQAYKNEAERAMAQREDIPMTNPLDDYAGVYSGNGITGMEVRVVDGALVCDYHGFIVELAHLQHNAFIGYIEDFEAYVPVSFLSDSEGNIVSLVFMLPPSQGSIMTIDKVH